MGPNRFGACTLFVAIGIIAFCLASLARASKRNRFAINIGHRRTNAVLALTIVFAQDHFYGALSIWQEESASVSMLAAPHTKCSRNHCGFESGCIPNPAWGWVVVVGGEGEGEEGEKG